jgi:cell division transport system permease protein
LLSITTVTIMTVALLSVTLIVAMQDLVVHTLKDVEQKLNLTVEIYDGLSEEQILEFKKELEDHQAIASIDYISKQAALTHFKERFSHQRSIIGFLDSLDYNPLYATFTIAANDSESFNEIREFLKLPTFKYLIKEIKDEDNQSDKINTFRNWTAHLNIIGLVLSIIFASIAGMILFNTITIGMHYRKREITIMQLVGASRTYMSLPYILEGILYVLLSVSFTVIIVKLGLLSASQSNIPLVTLIGSMLQQTPTFSTPIIFLIQTGVASGIAIIGSTIALARYFKQSRI